MSNKVSSELHFKKDPRALRFPEVEFPSDCSVLLLRSTALIITHRTGNRLNTQQNRPAACPPRCVAPPPPPPPPPEAAVPAAPRELPHVCARNPSTAGRRGARNCPGNLCERPRKRGAEGGPGCLAEGGGLYPPARPSLPGGGRARAGLFPREERPFQHAPGSRAPSGASPASHAPLPSSRICAPVQQAVGASGHFRSRAAIRAAAAVEDLPWQGRGAGGGERGARR